MIASAKGSKARAGCPSVKELARAADVSTRTVENDEDKNGAPFRTVDEYLAWRVVNRSPRSSGDGEGDDLREQKLRAEIAKINEEIRAKQLANDCEEGRLIPREQAIEEWSELLSVAKAAGESMIDAFAKEAPEELRVSARELAKHHIHLFLRILAKWSPKSASD